MHRWTKGMRDKRTGRRYDTAGTCENWIPDGNTGICAIPDGTDPLTVALMKLQRVEEVAQAFEHHEIINYTVTARSVVGELRKAMRGDS